MHSFLITGGLFETRLKRAEELLGKRGVLEIHRLEAEKKLLISQVREAQRILAISPLNPSSTRGLLVVEAQKLTNEAANSFLKTLEEPPGNTLIVLTAPNSDLVSETIFSRCLNIDLGAPKTTKTPAPQELIKLIKAGVGEKLSLAENFPDREEAIEFCKEQIYTARFLMIEITKNGSLAKSAKLAGLIEYLEQAKKDLEESLNVKIVISDLLLHYPS